MTSEARPAAAAGTWKLGDMVVNRLGLGAMRLTGSAAFGLGSPSDRDQSVRVLRRAVELGLAVTAAHAVTPAQVRLAWTLQQGPHVLAIPGTGDPRHLEANVAAAALRLSPGDMASLESVS